MNSKFKAKDIVQRVNQPESIGVVLDPSWDDQTETWTYYVQFGNTVTAVPESSLRGWVQAASAWERFRSPEMFSGADHFRATLTFHKLKTPTARVAYAFSTARTLFFPHQFKPLLKFLDGGGSGILIADDVGLGKTIEAGYILRELQARRNLERIVVLAPARLGTKWKRELFQRFDESFEIVKGSQFIDLSNALEAGKEVAPFRWIVSYEGARSENVQNAILSSRPSLDMLIVDEAHRLRNTETLQHRLGRLLCDLADYAIFLTATPVQNSLDDLWNLLKLLSEEQFPDREIFHRQVEENRTILESQRNLGNPAQRERAVSLLSRLQDSDTTRSSVSNTFLDSIVKRLKEANLSVADVSELNADIAQLNTLGHVVSRTRKSEAMPGCARREAMWCPVDLQQSERLIYDNVERLCRVNPDHSDIQSWGFQMATLMAFRATASCIPAAIRYFNEKLESKHRDLEINSYTELTSDELEEPDPDQPITASDLTNWFEAQRSLLAYLVDHWQVNGGVDSKFETLAAAIRSIWDEDDEKEQPRRKIVIFSFFRKTLEYLSQTLTSRDIQVRMIHGLINLRDRELAIDEFLGRSEVPILLTSEVGGEGIDLQRASVLINYDLPWNPMVVEQRIGRIDRIGQLAKRIVIVNFVVRGSIEERILQRLLHKIGIFESTIGEIDPIIGDRIEQLTRQSLSGFLSEEELEQELLKEERAIANSVATAKKVRKEAEHLFTSDQSLLDEISALTGERQIPAERDLWTFVNGFLGERYPGYLIPEEALTNVARTVFSPRLARDLENAPRDLGIDVAAFGGKAALGELGLTLSREIAYRHTSSDLVHLSHPLVKFIIHELDGRYGNEAFCLSIDKSSVLEQGLYAFAIRIIEIEGITLRNRFETCVAECSGDRLWTEKAETTQVLIEMMEKGQSHRIDPFPRNLVEELERRLKSGLDMLKRGVEVRESSVALARLEQRKAISKKLAELKLKRAKDQLMAMKSSGAKDFAIKMGVLKVKKAEEYLSSLTSAHTEAVSSGVRAWTDIAVGFLSVGI